MRNVFNKHNILGLGTLIFISTNKGEGVGVGGSAESVDEVASTTITETEPFKELLLSVADYAHNRNVSFET